MTGAVAGAPGPAFACLPGSGPRTLVVPPVPYEQFSARLQRLLDHARFSGGRARNGALAARYGVSRETARKWLTGLSLPELERMMELAVDFGGSFEWLATGRGDMLIPPKRSVHDEHLPYPPSTLGTLLSVVSSLPEDKQKALLKLLSG